jgi:serine O-acetyltransferase
MNERGIATHMTTDNEANLRAFWEPIRQQAQCELSREPLLADFFRRMILDHTTLAAAIAAMLAQKLHSDTCTETQWRQVFSAILENHPHLVQDMVADLNAIRERDRACRDVYQALCFFKGFHALAAYRLMHVLWMQNHRPLALQLQNRISIVFGVDIHPAARIGHGVMFDHATGIVVGETAVIGNNVSIMQGVTLGGTGKEGGDRHPKIRDGVLISVGATILGNIEIGEGAQIAAGSVVLEAVPAHTLVAGVPARIISKILNPQPALVMDHQI